MFATQDELSEDFGVVHGPATVCSPGDWAEHEADGDDVYLCDYEYDSLCWVSPVIASQWLRLVIDRLATAGCSASPPAAEDAAQQVMHAAWFPSPKICPLCIGCDPAWLPSAS